MKKKIVGIIICTLMITGALPVIMGANTSTEKIQPDDIASFYSSLVRIDISKGAVSLPKGLEIVGGNPGKWVDIIIPQNQLRDLSRAHMKYTILIKDVDAYSDQFRGSYHTLAQIEASLQSTATSYPSITRLFNIGTTYQGRTMWCLEISDNPGVDEGEPGVFFMGNTHAREWPTVEICLYAINQLTTQYSTNITLQNIVNNRRIWIVPVVNPDGYYRSHDQGVDWRKNMHYFPQYGTTGVDLNRNFDGSVNGNSWGAWGSISEASVTHYPDGETYCGPGALSEYETQAIKNMFLTNNICAFISWHTYSELVLWPWGYGSEHVPDNTYMSQIGQQIASRITSQYGSGTYTPQQSYGLYGTTGDLLDWAYGYSHYIQGKTTFGYTIEACQDFQPPTSYLDQICRENFDGGVYLLQQAQNIRDTVTPRVVAPVINPLNQDPDGSYNVSWTVANSAASHPDVYQLDELTGLTVTPDNAEAGTSLWTLDGFALSAVKSHSATHSYKSRYLDGDVSSMITAYPLPVTAGMSLSFWTWYNIEQDYDYAFVEVSKDGRQYDILGMYTGSSGSWQQKQFDLSAYAGKSIYIRFRYTTDSMTQNEGFYIDDITTIPRFTTVNTISSSIPTTYYRISGKPEGDYYYRVKGHNAARGWCDFSTLEKIHVLPPGEYVLNLNQVPFYMAETDTGAATAQMILNYLWWNSTLNPEGPPLHYPSQQTLFTGFNTQGGLNLNGDEICNGLNQYRPLPVDMYGYFFSPVSSTDSNEVLKSICIWLDYSMDFYNEYHSLPWPKPGYPAHVPIAVPTAGNYDNWMVVRGIHTNHSLWQDYPDFPAVTIFGFWLNDPKTGGIGGNTYKTTQTWMTDYYHPLNVIGDTYNGEYLAVTDPYQDFDSSKIDSMNLVLAQTSIGLSANEITIVRSLQSTVIPGIIREKAYDILNTAAYNQVMNILNNDDCSNDLVPIFSETRPVKTIYVTDPSGKDYWLVVFGDKDTTFVVRLDGQQGGLLEFSVSTQPSETYLEGFSNATHFVHLDGTSYFYPTPEK